MKKTTLIKTMLLIGALGMLLGGCTPERPASSSSEASSSESSSESSEISSSESSESSSESSSEEPVDNVRLTEVNPYMLSSNYRNLRINGYGYAGEQFTEHSEVIDGVKKRKYVVDNVKALVVPVDFTDYTCELYGETEDVSRENIRKIIFGSREETDWYSLSEYYKATSFGVCNITGTVAPWWHTGVSSKSIAKSNTGYAKDVAVGIQDYYRQHNDEINLADYDANKDGYVDSIIMLYTAPITTTGEVWWAFCWSVSGAYGKYTPEGKLEGANRFFWASMNFLYEKGPNQYYTAAEIKNGTAVADAHTMIHEYGHVLSLPDYYVTDYASGDYSALGGLDMMDNNIGDHNAYSKTLYGWINPSRIEGTVGSTTVTIRSTTTTGDAIIIPAEGVWNDTYLDQYIMIEFLTPEGVAEKDGKEQYLGYYPIYYSEAGIRMTLVDSRMASYSRATGSYEFSGYTWTTKPADANSYVRIGADNTASDSCHAAYKQIEVIPATGKTMKARSGKAGNECLFKAGQVFGANGLWENYMMNGIDGTKNKTFGYTISIDAINGYESATLTIAHV